MRESRTQFAFLTLPKYSMIALSNAVEPLRMANILTGETVYDWSIASLDGTPTVASNGLQLSPTVALDSIKSVDILFVCGGVEVQSAVSPQVVSALRRFADDGHPWARCVQAVTRWQRRACSTSIAPASTGRTCRPCARSSRASC